MSANPISRHFPPFIRALTLFVADTLSLRVFSSLVSFFQHRKRRTRDNPVAPPPPQLRFVLSSGLACKTRGALETLSNLRPQGPLSTNNFLHPRQPFGSLFSRSKPVNLQPSFNRAYTVHEKLHVQLAEALPPSVSFPSNPCCAYCVPTPRGVLFLRSLLIQDTILDGAVGHPLICDLRVFENVGICSFFRF